MKSKIFLLLILVLLTISCGSDKEEKIITVKKHLEGLPKTEGISLTPYVEYNLYTLATKQYEEEDYLNAFDNFVKLLVDFPNTDYELEVSYHVGTSIPIILKEYSDDEIEIIIKKYYNPQLYDNKYDQYLEEIHKAVGLIYSNDTYIFDYSIYKNISEHQNDSALKDNAYLLYLLKDAYNMEKNKTDVKAFSNNINILYQFIREYRSSKLIEEIFNDTTILANKRANYSKLNKREQDRYKEINSIIESLKPTTNYRAYINGASVKLRNRVPSKSDDNNPLLLLDDYEFVTILKSTRRYVPYLREYENWFLAEVDTKYGPIQGWIFSRYVSNVTNISTNTSLIYAFMEGLTSYNNMKYIEAADIFAKFINEYEVNYLTDKAAYLLWLSNNEIGKLTSSKESEYYSYVSKYEKFYVYDRNANILKSSNLIFFFIEKNTPDSPYKFKVNNNFIFD